jgi:hypothetical protein
VTKKTAANKPIKPTPKIKEALVEFTGRPVVGPAYYLQSGIIRSRTQFDRLRASGRIRPLFNIGSRLGQWKDVADADLARLVGQTGSEDDVA